MRSLSLVFVALLVTRLARADVDAFGSKLPDVTRVTLAASAPFPFAMATRSGSAGASSFVPAFSFEARIHRGHHGALIAVGGFPHADPGLLSAGSPQVTYFDVAYSLAATSSRRLRGFTGAMSLDIGPSLGVVGPTFTHAFDGTIESVDVDHHTTIGGRVSTHFDVLFGPALLGLVIGYRGGVPTIASARDTFEGVLFINIELGVALTHR